MLQARLLATRFFLGVYSVKQKKRPAQRADLFAFDLEGRREIDEPIGGTIVWLIWGLL